MSRRWQAIERRRRSYYRQAERWALEHLKERQQAALQALQPDLTPAEALARASAAAADERATEALLVRLYRGVALPFARESWTQLDEEGKAGGRTYGAGRYQVKADPPSEALQDEWVRRVRQYLATAGAEKVMQISETTRETIRYVLSQAVEAGASIDEMARALEEELPKLNRSRAVVISRTEVIAASNRGALIGAQTTGIKLNKEWISTLGARTREAHAAADGQLVPMGQPFTVGGERLEHPGDVSHGASAANVVQCRCAVGFQPVR